MCIGLTHRTSQRIPPNLSDWRVLSKSGCQVIYNTETLTVVVDHIVDNEIVYYYATWALIISNKRVGALHSRYERLFFFRSLYFSSGIQMSLQGLSHYSIISVSF